MSACRGSSTRATVVGFTLIEVLVALLLLGIMSALGYGTYREARISAERTEEALKRSREIEFGMRVLVMDFAQMVPRPVRDPLGQTRVPALRGFSGNGTSANTTASPFSASSSSALGSTSSMHFNSDPGFRSSFGDSSSTTIALAELTHAGWSNTAGQQRSTLQRVSYALVDDVLKRAYTTELDTVQGTTPQIQDLFGGVKTIQFRYLDGNQTWQNQWPPPTLPVTEALWTRPVAVEVTIEFKDWGRVRRLIEVAG
ncbi:MAG: type II secretion system minor pseudopilin GspJ [Steroidobacteraceae bacterium]